MNCTQCEERISDYLERALDAAAFREMEIHFAGCPACSGLLAGVREVMAWGAGFPDCEPQPWLASRIIANTPYVLRETWFDAVKAVGRWLIEPRTATALLTATLVLSWLGSLAGVTPAEFAQIVRQPSSIYYEAEDFLNRTYGRAYSGAVQRYYKTPLVTRIQLQLERIREIS